VFCNWQIKCFKNSLGNYIKMCTGFWLETEGDGTQRSCSQPNWPSSQIISWAGKLSEKEVTCNPVKMGPLYLTFFE
jgi:hypothetical protein